MLCYVWFAYQIHKGKLKPQSSLNLTLLKQHCILASCLKLVSFTAGILSLVILFCHYLLVKAMKGKSIMVVGKVRLKPGTEIYFVLSSPDDKKYRLFGYVHLKRTLHSSIVV